MRRLLTTLIAGLLVLAIAGPGIVFAVHALLPFVVVVGVVVLLVRGSWFFTRRW